MVWEIHQSSTSTPCFRLTKLEPLTQHSGSGLARLRQWWSLFISNLRACGATGSSVFWETQILSRLWGFLKIGDRGYHCVYIYIYIHTWNICTRKADGTGWIIQFQLVVFFVEFCNHLYQPWVNFHQGWMEKKSRTPKDWIWNSLRFGKRFTTRPHVFFLGIFKP